MSKIGHSSIDENGNSKGGKAGDQTGKEVCTRSYYTKNWSYVLRPLDKNVAEKMADACEKGCANDAIGYDQNQRNSLKEQAQLVGMQLDRIKTDCECDCSSFMTVCAECAGISIPYNGSNAPTTSTMKTAFMNTGAFELLTDEKYLTSDKYLKRGDILVAIGSHTVMVLENGSLADISQKSVNTTTQSVKAIDLSKYNTITDYKALANQIKYVIIRIGYRSSSTGSIVVDDLFKKHIDNCIANGIKNIGIYFYDQSINESEAIEQADWIVSQLKSYNINMPIYIDSEAMRNHDGRADNISKEQRTKNILAFCNRIQEKKYIAGVYASDSWFKSMLNYDQIKQFNIWCARYSTQKPTVSKYDIWQYGSEQFIWAQKPVDVNWIYNLSSNAQKSQNGANTSQIKSNIKIDNKVQVSDYLNVRSQPINTAPIVGKLYNNNLVQIFGYVHDWYMITTTMDKWVSSKYVKTNMAIATANLNYRSGVGTNCKPLGVYEKGTKIKVLNKANGTDGEWVLCVDDIDRFGWCSAKYLQMI